MKITGTIENSKHGTRGFVIETQDEKSGGLNTIAMTYGCSENDLKNAKIMAASFEMLEAIKSLLGYIDQNQRFSHKIPIREIDIIRLKRSVEEIAND